MSRIDLGDDFYHVMIHNNYGISCSSSSSYAWDRPGGGGQQ